jgi:hypothetical protein
MYKNSTVNSNDNLQFCWVQTDNDLKVFNEFGDIGRYIIKQHINEWWKNHPNAGEYQLAHCHICNQLASAELYGEFLYDYIASYLSCSPLSLANDPVIRAYQKS